MNPHTRACAAAAALLAAVVVSPWRGVLEADMASHMLLQFPLLVIAGALLAAGLAQSPRIARHDAHGINGLLLAWCVSSYWMIPRALDEALLSNAVAGAKVVSLVAAGAALRMSWRRAGAIVQLFFLGNWAWMTATVGLLYQQSPQRLCSVYLVDQQVRAGAGLVLLAIVLPLVSLWPVLRRAVAAEADGGAHAAAYSNPSANRVGLSMPKISS